MFFFSFCSPHCHCMVDSNKPATLSVLTGWRSCPWGLWCWSSRCTRLLGTSPPSWNGSPPLHLWCRDPVTCRRPATCFWLGLGFRFFLKQQNFLFALRHRFLPAPKTQSFDLWMKTSEFREQQTLAESQRQTIFYMWLWRSSKPACWT